ncbi:hypothetical protein U9M48_000961 [Paspalum notatum var. saurae]|uniref:Uncharacterized protein n=1 Tax=Paspalum notatum var. saurae TaxID=547442 RepID=A0AAQ3SHS2_PASNO
MGFGPREKRGGEAGTPSASKWVWSLVVRIDDWVFRVTTAAGHHHAPMDRIAVDEENTPAGSRVSPPRSRASCRWTSLFRARPGQAAGVRARSSFHTRELGLAALRSSFLTTSAASLRHGGRAAPPLHHPQRGVPPPVVPGRMQPGKPTPRSTWAAIASSASSSARAPDLDPRPGGGVEIRIAIFLSPSGDRTGGLGTRSPLPARHRLVEGSRWERDWKVSWPPRVCSSCSAQKTHLLDLMVDAGLLQPRPAELASSDKAARSGEVGSSTWDAEEHRDQVVERERRREAVELEHIGSQRRAVRSRSGRVVPRPHSLVAPRIL